MTGKGREKTRSKANHHRVVVLSHRHGIVASRVRACRHVALLHHIVDASDKEETTGKGREKTKSRACHHCVVVLSCCHVVSNEGKNEDEGMSLCHIMPCCIVVLCCHVISWVPVTRREKDKGTSW